MSIDHTNSGNIKIEINNEDSIINFLTKDHKANMSLLFYDFNNANQRILSRKQMHPLNLADVVIPEEAEEPLFGVSNLINNAANTTEDDFYGTGEDSMC